MRQRATYAILIIGTIFCGLLSRRIHLLPSATGDALYAVMMYFIVCCCSIKGGVKASAGIAVCICFAIEFSQLYRAPWINQLRSTLPGRLVLGQGFLWSDLAAYACGVVFAAAADSMFVRRRSKGAGSKTIESVN